jgi:hypothetical protein
LQKLKGKEIINYQSKNNDSTLILMKFAKMKEQLVGFKVFRKSKSTKKEQLQSVLNYVSIKGIKTSLSCIILVKKGCRLWNLFLLHYQKNKQKTIHRRISNRYFITIRKFKFERHTKQD